MTALKHPETAALAKRAYEASGHKTLVSFCAEYRCSLRAMKWWLVGDRGMNGIVRMIFEQIADQGFHPK